MSRNETDAHQELKRLAALWARDHGYSCIGFEIRLPNSGYRADVAAYKPAYEQRTVEFEGRTLRQRHPVIGTTAVFECKQSRSDLLNDSYLAHKGREKLKRLNERRVVLERLLKVHLPSAVHGDSLFQEFQTLNVGAVNHKGYQKVLRDIAALQRAFFHKTKFENLVRYRCANLFYLVTLDDIIADHELPLRWGLLVKIGNILDLRRKPMWLEAHEGLRLTVLQKIAVKSTQSFSEDALKEQEFPFAAL
jgi:hypothetical protein